ncbi:MAG: hypothetical protein AAGA92_09605 [Planctomycetota bacterium]
MRKPTTTDQPQAPWRGAALSLGVLVTVFCVSGATCSSGLRNPFAPTGPPAPQVITTASTLDQMIAAVNQNADRVQRLQSNNASITVPGVAGIPLLRGNIAAERPKRLRVQASTALTGPEVDVGSNDERFWFWVKRNEPPAVYFARHDQFAGSAAQQSLPIEPEWLWDALGLTRFEPTDQHTGPLPYASGTVEVRSVLKRPGGRYTKSTVIDASTAWVLEQHVYDGSGALLASSQAKQHRYYPQAGVSLPQKVELRVPRAQLSLAIDLGEVQVNAPSANPAIWAMPAMSGYEQVDLGAAALGLTATHPLQEPMHSNAQPQRAAQQQPAAASLATPRWKSPYDPPR